MAEPGLDRCACKLDTALSDSDYREYIIVIVVMARSRNISLPLVAATLALLAAWSTCWTFVGSLVTREAAPAMRTAMRAGGKPGRGGNPRPHDVLHAKETTKEKQAKMSKKMALKGDVEDEEEKKMMEMEWPVMPTEEFKLMLHVEYDKEHGVFPQPGNQEVEKFYREMQKRFGSKVRILHNHPLALEKLGAYDPEADLALPKRRRTGAQGRKGAFEVVDISSETVLYSKLQTGLSLVSVERGDMEPYMGAWMEKLAAKYPTLDGADAAEAVAEEVPAEEPVDA